MFAVFIVVFIVMLLTVGVMAVGVLFGRDPIRGSCGGLNNLGIERACDCKDVCEETHKPISSFTKPVTKPQVVNPKIYRP